MTRLACRSLFVFAFVLLFTPLLVSASSQATTATSVPAAAPSKRLVLTVDAPVGPLALGDEAALTIVVANPMAEPVENVLLYLPQERGVEWIEPADGGWVTLGALAAGESRTMAARLRVAAMPRSGYLRFFVGATGDDAKPARERVDLLVPRAPQETATAPAAGGEVAFANGRVRMVFPPGWNEQDAQLTFQLEELYRQQRKERGRLLLFTLTATVGGAPEASFDAPVAVTLALGDLKSDDPTAPAPTVSTAPTADENWTTVESAFDPAAGTLAFTTTEPAAVQAATDPELWRLEYNPPGASAYSGSATYSYPIELPPGIGGLTPDLTLSYSSRAAEGQTYPAMSQGFGAGWGLPQAQINNGSSGRMYNDDLGGTQGNTGLDKNAFTLVLNGMNYYLNPLDTAGRYGTYKAIGSPELFILYAADLSIPNVSGEYWLVRTADGTTYTFGRTEDAEQVIWPVEEARNTAQPRNDRFSPYNWKLNSIVDVHGNRVEYVYDTACGKVANGSQDRGQNRQDEGHVGEFECSEVDTAVKEIRYSFSGGAAKTVISFTNEPINDGVRKQKMAMTAGLLRPTQIKVIQNGNTNAPASTYTFFYTGNSHGFAPWSVSTQFWMLTHIYHSGSDGKTLPAQSFSYSRIIHDGCDEYDEDEDDCVKLLTQVDNGYGGVTLLGYEPYRDWQLVQYVETWDGVVRKRDVDSKGQSRVVYDHTGATACFDTAGSGCHMGTQQPSETLVGFNKATVKTQEWDGSTWKTLVQTETDFINANYLLLGKVSAQRQLDPSNSTVLAKDEYSWQSVASPDGNYVDDQLASETHTLNPAGTQLKSSIVYTYYPLNPPAGSYGVLKTKLEKDEADNPYRCTEYAYVSKAEDSIWLINRPERETVKGGDCAGPKKAETLYRYAGAAFPGDKALDARGLLTYILRWSPRGMADYYATEKREYHANGLPSVVTTFSDLSSTTTYVSTEKVRNTTTTTYTALGLPETITTHATDIQDQTQTIGYDTTFPWLVASVKDANNLTTSYTYDGFLRTLVYDGNNHLTMRFSDVFGRLVLAREYSGDTWTAGKPTTYAPYADTRYTYSALDELVGVMTSAASNGQTAAALRQTLMSYVPLGRKAWMSDADMGVWTYGYDDAGNLSRQTDAAGQVICFYYDNLNRLTRRVVDATPGDACPLSPPTPDTNHLASYTYGQSAAAHNVGRVTQVSWGSAPGQNNDAFTYDAQGRLSKQTRKVNGQTFTYEVTLYDALDRPTQYKLSNATTAETINVGYDQEGENTLTVGSTPLLIDNVTYNERGQLALISRDGGAPDTSFTYYNTEVNFGRLQRIGHGGTADSYPDYSYTTYDSVGNLKGLVVTNANAGTYSFGYDALNRLKTAELSGASTANYNYTYAYNELGNIPSTTLSIIPTPPATWQLRVVMGSSKAAYRMPITGEPTSSALCWIILTSMTQLAILKGKYSLNCITTSCP